MAKRLGVGQGSLMADREPDRLSTEVAEEILRRIFGDDLLGCTVTLQEIAEIVHAGAEQRTSQHKELVEMYEKAMEALNLLATPPGTSEITDLAQLNGLLGERLDAIQKLTKKVMETTALLQKGGP
jgi:hypothetical protein